MLKLLRKLPIPIMSLVPAHVNLGGMRAPYKDKHDVFTEDKLVAKEPMAQFDDWFNVARRTDGIHEPNAMCLATATKEGRPSARMVLLKAYGADGFKFFTNYESRKAQELAENPHAALNFFWEPLNQCVRIEGTVEKLGNTEAEEYFDSRPVASRIGASISPQSRPIPNRDFLNERENQMQVKINEGGVIQKPTHWGGYILKPDVVEFWQGQSSRIHDRIRFRKLRAGEEIDEVLLHKGLDDWVYERLGP